MPHPKLQRATSEGGSDFNHPAGGFVLTITGAEDFECDSYMSIAYDIAEGPCAGHYEYSNEFRRYYESSFGGATQFEKFMAALEDSNPGFDMMQWQTTWSADALVGLKVGAVFRERIYTSNKGEDRRQPRLYYCCNAQSIRGGKFKVPDPVDERTSVTPTQAPSITRPAAVSSYDDEIPF